MSDDRLHELERRLRSLEDEREIARLLAAYGPLVDTGDADGAAALWTDDGRYDAGDWRMDGRAEIAAMVRSDAHRGLVERGCCHFFGPPVITVDGDAATAVCESILLARRDSGGYAAIRAGVHLLRLARTSRGWRITERVARQFDGTPQSRDLVAAGLQRPPSP